MKNSSRYKLSKIDYLIWYIEKDCTEFHDPGRFNGEVLIERAVKLTLHILYDKGLFDNYDSANVNGRGRPDICPNK